MKMKKIVAIALNFALVAVALFTVSTSASFAWNRPAVPEELKK